MGQSCSTVQRQVDQNRFRQQNEMESLESQIQKQIQQHHSKQRDNIKKITFIQSTGQLIYQFNDSDQTVEKLQVQEWNGQDRFESLEVQQFCNKNSFLAKVKLFNKAKPVWKIFSSIKVMDLSNQALLDFGYFYHNFNRIKQVLQIQHHFIHADKCSLNAKEIENQQACFIMQSQTFQLPIVSLKKLGNFMKKNDICWQDGQFVYIINRCCQKIKMAHDNNLFLFEDFLIDQNGQVYCVGGLISSGDKAVDENGQDFHLLSIYLAQNLCGEQMKFSSFQDYLSVILSFEEKSTFKHPKTLQLLSKLYKLQNEANLKLNQDLKIDQTPNIHHYVNSYRIKNTIQPSILLSERYNQLGQYWKAKQVLFQRLSILTYQQKGSISKESFMNQNQKMVIDKKGIKKSDYEELCLVLQKLIDLERHISKITDTESELEGLIKEYQIFVIMLSFQERRRQNCIKALSILQKARQFLKEEDVSWQLSLHLAQSYFLAGKLDQSQDCFKRSLQLQINQANLCLFVTFYASVLNWQKAFTLISQYEGLITDDYVYDFLMAKILLAKALCTSPRQKQKEEQRTQFFYDSIKVAKRVVDRKNVSELILCQSFQIVGDGYFYMKQYQLARQFYQKGLAISCSVDFARRKTLKLNQDEKYEPTYLQCSSLDYSRSLSLHQFGNSSLKKTSTLKQSVGRSTTFNSLISQNQSKQSSYLHQLSLLFDHNKRAILLSSTANCLFMQRKFTEAVKVYQEARNAVLPHNNDLKNSIIGNMALCLVENAKNDQTKTSQIELKEGKQLLEHIISVTKEENPSKLQNDINYVFLLSQLQCF